MYFQNVMSSLSGCVNALLNPVSLAEIGYIHAHYNRKMSFFKPIANLYFILLVIYSWLYII